MAALQCRHEGMVAVLISGGAGLAVQDAHGVGPVTALCRDAAQGDAAALRMLELLLANDARTPMQPSMMIGLSESALRALQQRARRRLAGYPAFDSRIRFWMPDDMADACHRCAATFSFFSRRVRA